ncbi:MAG TPA: GTP-binding protein, partial [Ramlibacter sp.]|nr:GTP-binding protein [Ramlibacter sp.]
AFRWREAAGVGPIFDGGHGTHAQHDHAIRAHCFTIDEPLDAQALAHWLELLAAMRGERLLRFKGLVCAAAHPQQPLVLHGAQHVIHPPQRLARWPSDDRRSRLVFITHAIERGELERTLRKFAGVSPLEALT